MLSTMYITHEAVYIRPGGDYFRATGTVQGAVLAATSSTGALWYIYDPLGAFYPGITVLDNGARDIYLNGTSMASPHAAGIAALVKQQHPGWGPAAVTAAVQRSAQHLDYPADWEPLGPGDEREVCYENHGRTSFFGHGLVDAAAAAQE